MQIGPSSYAQGDDPEYEWPVDRMKDNPRVNNGICYQRSVLNLRRIEDGTSKTYLGGEKYLKPSFYESGESWGDDACYYTGVDHDCLRWAGDFPARDQEGLVAPWIFGGAHPGGFQMVMCDGSVHNIPFDIDIEIHRNLANRHDGELATLP